MRNTYILLFCFLAFSTANAQHLSPTVIGSAGASFSTSTASMDMTVGEVVIETFNNNTILTQGFHQGIIKVETIVTEIVENVKVYPNPTTSIITVELEKNGNAELILIDVNGKIVLQEKMANQQKKGLDLRQLAEGNYFLQLIMGGKKSVYQINKSK
jgi:hypothetical protein